MDTTQSPVRVSGEKLGARPEGRARRRRSAAEAVGRQHTGQQAAETARRRGPIEPAPRSLRLSEARVAAARRAALAARRADDCAREPWAPAVAPKTGRSACRHRLLIGMLVRGDRPLHHGTVVSRAPELSGHTCGLSVVRADLALSTNCRWRGGSVSAGWVLALAAFALLVVGDGGRRGVADAARCGPPRCRPRPGSWRCCLGWRQPLLLTPSCCTLAGDAAAPLARTRVALREDYEALAARLRTGTTTGRAMGARRDEQAHTGPLRLKEESAHACNGWHAHTAQRSGCAAAGAISSDGGTM